MPHHPPPAPIADAFAPLKPGPKASGANSTAAPGTLRRAYTYARPPRPVLPMSFVRRPPIPHSYADRILSCSCASADFAAGVCADHSVWNDPGLSVRS